MRPADAPDLSPTQRRCLAEVEEHPGTPDVLLPGGRRTVQALMRRELVQWGEGTTVHPAVCTIYGEHRFQTAMHLDGCHHFSSSGSCDCGAWIKVQHERGLKDDPYSAIWMLEDCERCQQLRDGARPRAHVELGRG